MWSRFKAQHKKEEKCLFNNGSQLLEGLIKSCNYKSNHIRVFSAKELDMATENYNDTRILQKDYYYNIYKGTHDNDRLITVKKYQDNCPIYVEWCINEIVIASQMNHKHVLKLLGCCLETEIPILVYEYTGNGTICNHIFWKEGSANDGRNLSWLNKLRIVTEIADSITYLHMANSMPIIHRSMRGPNILLNQQYVVKLCGFEFSVPIPIGETHVDLSSDSRGIGFIAPESYETGRYTEKSDVYGYGAILLEVLTGKSSKYQWRSSDLKNDEELQQLPPMDRVHKWYMKAILTSGGNMAQSTACGELVLICMKENPEERPTMKYVTQELRHIMKLQTQLKLTDKESDIAKNSYVTSAAVLDCTCLFQSILLCLCQNFLFSVFLLTEMFC